MEMSGIFELWKKIIAIRYGNYGKNDDPLEKSKKCLGKCMSFLWTFGTTLAYSNTYCIIHTLAFCNYCNFIIDGGSTSPVVVVLESCNR